MEAMPVGVRGQWAGGGVVTATDEYPVRASEIEDDSNQRARSRWWAREDLNL
jgi:hypothetical protein